jgi:acetoin utilization protein AcuB
MRLADVMSTPVESTTPHTSAEEAWELMRRRRIHHLAVLNGKRLVGVLSMHDVGDDRGPTPPSGSRTVADVMSRHVVSANPDTTVREAANLLRGHAVGCLPVLERGKAVGMVTVSDLLELVGRGAERPVARTKRWTLKHRGPRRRPNQGAPR